MDSFISKRTCLRTVSCANSVYQALSLLSLRAWERGYACACMYILCWCVSAVQEKCWHIIHFLRACSISWLVQSVSTPQKTRKGDWVHSRVGNLPSSEKLPAGYTIRPLQRRIWHIGCLLTKLFNVTACIFNQCSTIIYQ